MTRIERDRNHILLAILSELETFSTIDEVLFETQHPYVERVRHVGIPYRPAVWFDQPLSASRRKDLTRATDSLSRDGLITRTTEPKRDRVTHLRLTPSGFRQALQLADGKADLGRLTESLARIDWADELRPELTQLASSD